MKGCYIIIHWLPQNSIEVIVDASEPWLAASPDGNAF